MKLQRKLTNKELAEIVALGPGVRNYRGEKTLFYNGDMLWDEDIGPLVYDQEERESWKVIIVLPGVEVIPETTFYDCKNVQIVIMSDTVTRIEKWAFGECYKLGYVKLSTNLECIGDWAFNTCLSLTSIFIPLSCREIGEVAFQYCESLIILTVPQTTMLGDNVIGGTKLIKASPFEEDELQLDYFENYENNEQVNTWIKDLNEGEEYSLHRACSSFNPLTDIIYEIVKIQGLKSLKKENEIGITPLQYLEENPFASIDQRILGNRYILELMGETV
ncbi:hypothetical protein CTEN210_03572 [Chaetoceros tenuissimus]|uniref:Leucine-rich repeat domain-containing protein n=1 Tax=Chaetoceros tenuissimus TaxID=426638 RepID=A0AAD3CJ75_9STRA|nr:hypothetical protein CTEN210_03572 [Chaetoceros tenuissimus]